MSAGKYRKFRFSRAGVLAKLMKSPSVGRIFAISLAVTAVLSGVATYVAMAGATLVDDQPAIVLLLLNLDLILALLLAFFDRTPNRRCMGGTAARVCRLSITRQISSLVRLGLSGTSNRRRYFFCLVLQFWR